MRIISGASKTGQALLARAAYNQGENLRSIYGRWSSKKEEAMKECKREYAQDKGYDFRIISHNRTYFSVAWNYTNTETGEVMTKIKSGGRATYIIDGSRAKKED